MDKEAVPDLSTTVLFFPDTKTSNTASSDEFTTLYPGAISVATPIDKGVMVELVAVLPVVVPDEVVPVALLPPPPPPQAVKSKDVAIIAVIVIMFFIVLFPFDY